VVKLIWQQAALPTHMDGSILFARWRRQCDLVHAFLGSPECKSQTTSRSVQPFLHSSRQTVAILYIQRATCFPLKLPAHAWRMWTPSNILYMVPWAHASPEPKWHFDRFGSFCRAHYCLRLRPIKAPTRWSSNINRFSRFCTDLYRHTDRQTTLLGL